MRCHACDVRLTDANRSAESVDTCRRCATEIRWEHEPPEPLGINPPPQLICAWCKTVIRRGPVPSSHGICHRCAEKVVGAPLHNAYWVPTPCHKTH